MLTLYDFLQLAMDNYYKINVYCTDTGEEVVHQLEVGEIEDFLINNKRVDLLDSEVVSWDIVEENNNEFCINID